MSTTTDLLSPDVYAASAIDDLPQIWGGLGKLVREGLGLSAFGIQVLDLPPGYRPNDHDETATRQEEVYLALRGSGTAYVGGDEIALDANHVIAVGANVTRGFRAGAEGLRLLCVGGVPGEAFEIGEWSTGAV